MEYQLARPPTVAIVVDNPLRDMPGILLLANYLCRRGVVCHLVPFNVYDWELCNLAPDYVLLNYLRTPTEPVAKMLVAAGIPLAVHDTEGGVLMNMQVYADQVARDPALRRAITRVFCWGPRLADFIVKEQIFSRQQVTVTGAPRFDFYSPTLRAAALASSPHAETGFASMVLLNSNFSYANPIFQTREREREVMVRYFGYTEEFADRLQRNMTEAMHLFAALANTLAEKFPKTLFVYRPHPFEAPATYDALLARRSNLRLLKQGTVDGWIFRSKAVLQTNCTTAIEAGFADVPALQPDWIPMLERLPDSEAVSEHCESIEQMIERVGQILEGRFTATPAIRSSLDTIIGSWFYRLDGKAHERIGELILNELPTCGAEERFRACRELVFGPGRFRLAGGGLLARVVNAFVGRAVYHLWRGPRWRRQDWAWWDKSEKGYNAASVTALLSALAPHLGDGAMGRPLRVEQTRDAGYYISCPERGRSVTVRA